MTTSDECARVIIDTVPLLMRMIGSVMRRQAFDDEPASIGHVRMLKLLHERQRTLSELAARYHVAPSTMSRTVDVLVRRDWVERRADPHDRRQVLLRLTQEGELVHVAVQEHAQRSLSELVEELDESEREQVFQGMAALQRMILKADRSGLLCPHEPQPPETGNEQQ
ncbi:MAG TPA: MarR family transcriptional regulator [Roseiflexaceae bacterium]|nr:MarR family transcriptional regulator [Roseiflexaceae bacterium]